MLNAVQVTGDDGDWGQEQNRKVVIALTPSLGQAPENLWSRQMPNETQRGGISTPGTPPSHADIGTIPHYLAP